MFSFINKKKAIFFLFLLFFSFSNVSCACNRGIPVRNLFQLEMTVAANTKTIIIESDIDLEGKRINLGECQVVKINARLSNGIIIGNHLKIESSKGHCFQNIQFQGSYRGKPDIDWFDVQYDIVYDNARELNYALQLTSLCEKKRLLLPAGKTIYVRSDIEQSKWRDFLRTGTVVIPSGVTFDLNGSTIRCIPNKSHQYNILFSRNTHNIIIRNGKVQGDLKSHKGDKGEWGYGIELQGVDGFVLENLECCECWGDGIDIQVSSDGDGNEYSSKTIRGHCKNGIVRNVYCHDNYRQGMSVQGILGLKVIRSTFSKSEGTNPQCGVDIEPYTSNNVVAHVVFDGCQFDHNVNSGLLLWGESIYDIEIANCLFSKNSGWDLSIQGNEIEVRNCKSVGKGESVGVRIVGDCEDVVISKCDLKGVYAQGFSKGKIVRNVKFNECIFFWDGKKHANAFSDEGSLEHSDITFNKCSFDFSTGQFGDGNMVYQTQGMDYHYNYDNCTFNCGSDLVRLNSTQNFNGCKFYDCKGLLVVLSASAPNKMEFKNCWVDNATILPKVYFFSQDDNISVDVNIDDSHFCKKRKKSDSVHFQSNRLTTVRMNGRHDKKTRVMFDRESIIVN